MKLSENIRRFIEEAFFPERCPYCDRVITPEQYACRRCAKKLPEMNIQRYAMGGYLCAAPFPYEDPYARAVKRLKFNDRGDLARPLAVQIVQAVLDIHQGSRFDLITCVPMHEKDRRIRGYNQAELLARECAGLMGLPYADTIEKYKRNKPQHTLSGANRERNVQGVYRLMDKSLIEDKNILIIDDIITSGHTLGACAKMLRKSTNGLIGCAVVCTVTERRQTPQE